MPWHIFNSYSSWIWNTQQQTTPVVQKWVVSTTPHWNLWLGYHILSRFFMFYHLWILLTLARTPHDCVCSLLSQVGGQRSAEFHIGSTAAQINEREVAHDGTGNARRNWPQKSPKPKPCLNVFKNKTANCKSLCCNMLASNHWQWPFFCHFLGVSYQPSLLTTQQLRGVRNRFPTVKCSIETMLGPYLSAPPPGEQP